MSAHASQQDQFRPGSIDIDALSPDELRTLATALSVLEKDRARQKWQNLFPDEGPLRRELYPRHMEFFAAGAKYRERLFMAANRCLTPWTFVETPDGAVPIAELLLSKDPHVLSWDGGSQCVRPMRDGILKGLEPAFRLVLGTGRFFDCTRKHQVLTSEGWLSLDRLMSRVGGLRCWHKAVDYQANCVADGHLDDPAPRPALGSGQEQPPSQGGAQTLGRLIFAQQDEVAHRFRRSHACRGHDRLSTHDDPRQIVDLFAPFAAASSPTPVLSLSDHTLALSRLALASGLLERSAAQSLIDQFQAASHGGAEKGHGAAYTLELCDESVADAPRSPEHIDLHQIGGRSLHDGRRTAIFFPSHHLELIGGESIVACVPLGLQPIVDAHVPGTNNYFAGGVIHHNCGKTVAGAYEVGCHLTGDYPHWWQGRRFDHPISAWVAGDTNETTRDIIQKQLLGEVDYTSGSREFDGVGIIPIANHGKAVFKMNTNGLLDQIMIKHKSGRWSNLSFKSYEQGRKVFQGTAKQLVWLDEEPPMSVYNECLIRTATTDGIVMLTFTPLLGMSDVVRSYLQPEAIEEPQYA
jgi:phage terminase large subunit-like protein